MKKLLIIFVVLLLVGCAKSNDIICERNSIDDYVYQEKVIATLDGDNIKSIKNELSFDKKEEASLYCESLKSYKTYYDSKLDYECTKKKITINNFELLIEVDDIIGSSKEDFISLMTDNKYACK